MANPKKILIDADALVAIAKEDDSNHTKAIKILKRLKKDFLFITQFTIPEAVTVLSYKVSQREACRFLKEARTKNLVKITADTDLEAGADELFLAQKRKNISWIDCFNVSVVKAKKLDGIFSFDKFYSKQKIRVFS